MGLIGRILEFTIVVSTIAIKMPASHRRFPHSSWKVSRYRTGCFDIGRIFAVSSECPVRNRALFSGPNGRNEMTSRRILRSAPRAVNMIDTASQLIKPYCVTTEVPQTSHVSGVQGRTDFIADECPAQYSRFIHICRTNVPHRHDDIIHYRES